MCIRDSANAVYAEIQAVDCFEDVKLVDFDHAVAEGSIVYIDDSLYAAYLQKVAQQAVTPGVCAGAGLKVVYTPLHGTGNKLVREILKRTGIEDVCIVKEQENPDGNFTTCPYQMCIRDRSASWRFRRFLPHRHRWAGRFPCNRNAPYIA